MIVSFPVVYFLLGMLVVFTLGIMLGTYVKSQVISKVALASAKTLSAASFASGYEAKALGLQDFIKKYQQNNN